jgi:molybdopterin molybdotransferase
MREADPTPERTEVSVNEARDIVLGSVRPLGDEVVGLFHAQGRVLVEAIHSGVSIPPADNSAMDGFAVRAEDAARAPAELRVVEELPAGRASTRRLGPGEAARIMTGAAIPEGADAVVRVEDTRAEGDRVTVLVPASEGLNIRRAGADVRPGTPIASPGTRIGPALVGMLAAIGRASVRVSVRPRVAILATGDELVEPEELGGSAGRIVTSNSYALVAALRAIGAEPVYLGIAPDEPDAIRARFQQALACDAVVSTGGVSVGDRDWIKQVLGELGGRMRLWRVRMQPGAPLAFVMVEGKPVFGLPGNPVSTLVTFEQFVRPALLRMMRHRNVFRPVETAIFVDGYEKKPGRTVFARVRIEEREGERYAFLTGDQSSGVLLSMVRADALAILPAEARRIDPGSPIHVQRLDRDDARGEPGA